MTVQEAKDAVTDIMQEMVFGDSNTRVVIEEFMDGEEASILAFIDGKKIAAELAAHIEKAIRLLPEKPLLIDVVVGDDPVVMSYVRIKERMAKQVGADFSIATFPETITEQELISQVDRLQANPQLRGLLIQLPLPPHIHTDAVLARINPEIDVDCLTQENTKLLYDDKPRFIPPTAAAILELLKATGQDLSDKNILVVGQGKLVGRPVTALLKQRNLSVFTADQNTPNTVDLLQKADIIISGTGRQGIVTVENIKPGAIVIDAGTAEMDGGIIGDIDFEKVSPKTSYISPVPGGVGPVTVTKLLENLLRASDRSTL
jgi:methylenetetrahydrofolate dehydrogenase (NADP+)/methenyltetrahydrofolate cyclohydrolase